MSESTLYPSLQGRCVLITGGATGIGATLVEQFLAQGAKVGFIDVDVPNAQALQAALEPSAGGRLHFEPGDISNVGRLQQAIRAVRARLGPIQVLVNNAANDQRHKIEDTTSESWDAGVAVNLKHQFFAAQEVIADMKALGGGSIINFGSVSWMLKQGGMP